MDRSMQRRSRWYKSIHQAFRVQLHVELLEDRNVMSVISPLPDGSYEPGRILVGDASGQTHQIELAAGVSVEQALADYAKAPGVTYAEPDYVVHAGLTPNDTYYGLEYGLNNTGQIVNGTVGTPDADIDAPEAWNITTGSVTTVVADIDTGIDYNHPDLYLNVWINQQEIPTTIRNNLTDIDGDGLYTFYDLNDPSNQGPGKITDLNGDSRIDGGDLLNNASGWEDGVDNDADGRIDDLIGWNFVANTNDPLDDNGHGSHTAGTIGAIGNNVIGVTGVNWKVQIAAMKFLNAQGSGSISAAQAALDLSVAKGILISNNSWGGGGYSTSFFNSLVAANNAGHIFVAAAGNASSNNDLTPSYPASYNVANVIAVAATDSKDQLASFSNYGATSVDIAAPGVNTASTYSNGGYVYLSGTSMATPHVTGVVALVRTLNPSLDVASTIGRILNNADPIAALNGKVAGSRRLNAFGAVNAGGPDLTGPRITAAQPIGATSISGVRLTFSEAIDPNSFKAADDISNSVGLTNIAVSVVTGSGNTQFDVTFDAVTAPGSYSFDVGPHITDTAAVPNEMDQNADGVNGGAADVYHASFTITATLVFSNNNSVAIPDRSTVTSIIPISQTVTIADLNVQVNITHTYDSDLYITLTSPWGKTVVLANRRGGSGDNFDNTIFDDEAAVRIRDGSAPFSGSYKPEAALSAYDNHIAGGNWTLTISDRSRGDVGTLNSWSLFITPTAGGSSVSVTSAATDNDVTDSAPTIVKSTGFGLSAFDVVQETLNTAPATDSFSVEHSTRSVPTEEVVAVSVGESSRDALDVLFGETGGDDFGAVVGWESGAFDSASLGIYGEIAFTAGE